MMKNLNQLIKLPVLDYSNIEIDKFDKLQSEKLIEEIEEFMIETDTIKKACELMDVIQVALSFLDRFDIDTIDQAYRLNLEKHKERKRFAVIGKYEIFKIMYKK
jgi:predicted house-cleaning noncanonical NTP pyrophosphatase (MazG superfamily)